MNQYQTALSRFEDRERTRLWAARVGEDASVTHRCYLALTLWHLGYPEQALKVNAEMRELAREIGHPYTLAYAGHHTSWLYHCLKLPNEMLAINDDTLRLSTEHGFPLFQATASIYLGAASLLQGTAAVPLPLLMMVSTGIAPLGPDLLCRSIFHSSGKLALPSRNTKRLTKY